VKIRATALPILLASLVLAGCTSRPPLTTDPIKTFDPDNRPIERPREIEENQYWDIADHTFVNQVGKVLDLNVSGRWLGQLFGLCGPKQADNVNALDEPVDSSWYTRRHFYRRLSLEALRKGPNATDGPDTTGVWAIVSGKFEGGTAGFTIEDRHGDRYLLKFDSQGNNEMASAAEVISTKILYACGYNVPENTVVCFQPRILRIDPGAKYAGPDKIKRPMTADDLQQILSAITIQSDGRIRCLASKYLTGAPVGIFNFEGRRRDDPNDRVDHEHRRELRGLKVISSWLNDADRRAANTLDMYVTDGTGRGYVKHHLIDMGSTLGSNNKFPHPPNYGNEYLWDPRTVGRSLISLGFYHKPWDQPLPMPYPELGYFENETFDPAHWYPTYPNPAFEKSTDRDAYWGAKLVTAFTAEEIAAIVSSAQYSNPAAARELTRLLAERRNLIGRYWFARINPLDRFRCKGACLIFTDLAIEGGLESAEMTEYRYRLSHGTERLTEWAPLAAAAATSLPLPEDLVVAKYTTITIQTRRNGGPWSKRTRVTVYKQSADRFQIVRIEREES
jgi:hypothetical protein